VSLRTLQQGFRREVCEIQPPKKLAIIETPKFRRKARLEVYRYAYFARILESLEDDFAEVVKKAGKRKFSDWCRAYLKKTKPRFQCLGEVSRDLPAFIQKQKHPKAKALSELARFEWLQMVSFLEEENTENNMAALTEVAPENFDSISFKLHASVVLFESKYNVPKSLKPKKTWGMIYTQDGIIRDETLNETEFKILKAIQKGWSLKKLYKLDESSKLMESFSRWSQKKILHRFQLGENKNVQTTPRKM